MNKKLLKFSLSRVPSGAILGVVILLPCIGFFLGTLYQRAVDGKFSPYPDVTPSAITISESPSITPVMQSMTSCQSDNDCTLYNPQSANTTTLCCHNQDMFCTKDQSGIVAVNKDYFQQQVQKFCGVKRVCPMYMMVCPADIRNSLKQLQAKCVQNTCQKSLL